jgi:Concanavalin A-like lectin/glucanases superfamily/FG-GAP-like repeat
MFLRNTTTGGLYLWTDVTANPDAGTLSYTAHAIAVSGWNTGATLALQAEDVNHDGITDLRTVAGMTVTTYLTGNVTGTTATLTAQPPQTLTTATHQWTLGTTATGAAGSAPDAIGTATLTGTGNAAWHTGDLYSPDLQLNVDATGAPSGTPTGLLTSSGRLIDTTASFSVSAWAKPIASGGVVISEDGAHTARFFLRLEPTDKTWRFGMATADTTTATYDIARSPQRAQLGVWTHLEAGFDTSTGIMALYVNGTLAATAHHYPAVTWPTAGNLIVGTQLAADTRTGWFAGQLADVQTFADAHLVGAALNPPPPLPAAAGQIIDIDGDLLPDLVYWDTSGGSMFVSRGASSGGTLARATSVPLSSGWATVNSHVFADWDGDGKLDLLGKNGSNDLLIWRNVSTPGNVAFAAYVGLGNDWASVTQLMTGDFNGDRKTDIAALSLDGNTMYIIPNTSANGTLSRGPRVTLGTGWASVSTIMTVDYDGDGITDFVGKAGNDGYAWRMTYDGAYHNGPNDWLGNGWSGYNRIFSGDFNGDGRIDIAAFANNYSDLWVIPNTTTNHVFSRGTAIFCGSGWSWQYQGQLWASDYDLDGYTDLIGRGADQMFAFRNQGTNPVQFAPYTFLGNGWANVGTMATRH